MANKIVFDGKSYGVNELSSLPKELDPRYIYTERREDITFFFRKDSPLSNHHACTFDLYDKSFNCSEQAYFYKKCEICGDTSAKDEIMKLDDPRDQKRLGGSVQSSDEWEAQKFKVMKEICTAKFAQSADLRKFLLETETTYLCEDNPNDSTWGLGASRNDPSSVNAKSCKGNQMGKTLMAIRTSLQDSTEN